MSLSDDPVTSLKKIREYLEGSLSAGNDNLKKLLLYSQDLQTVDDRNFEKDMIGCMIESLRGYTADQQDVLDMISGEIKDKE